MYTFNVLSNCQKLYKSIQKEAPTLLVTLPASHFPKD